MSDRVQFCRDDMDISGDFDAEDTADEVRVWDDDAVIVAVERTSEDLWVYASSDYGPGQDWPTDSEFGSWKSALSAFGVTGV